MKHSTSFKFGPPLLPIRSILFLFAVNFLMMNARAQTFPAGFSQVAVGNIYYPTSMAMAPDGRIFATEKAGKVRIVKNGTVLATPFLQVTVDQLNERGLSSVALDPNFSSNHYVYIYYTVPGSPSHNRLSRFTANGDVAVTGSEVILLDFGPLANSIHNAGGMAFGPDGKLYIAIGNDNVNSNSQDLNNYKGKLLRINPDGSVPADNPFTGSESAKRIWAYGFRNPWTIDIQPGTGKIFVDDVGEASWEEINNATVGGKNFGWPNAEGMSSNTAYTNPVFTYPHGSTGTTDGCAITGGCFFNPASTNYPTAYTGAYFFIDYCNHWINYLDPANGQRHNFATGLASAGNYVKVGTDGNLYYFSISQNMLYKIIYSSNNAPVITNQPQNISVPQGQPASFSVSSSGATPLNYQWKKNGVNITGANSATYTISSAQVNDTGMYSVTVSNSYGSTTSHNAHLTVTAPNSRPVATILTPGSGTFYRSGDSIHFSGDGHDPEDGTLPASAFHWIVEFHHNSHYHPGPNITPGIKSGAFSTTFGETSANVFFRLILVVSDSHGLTDTAFVDIHPVTSMLNLASHPSGLQLLLDAQPQVTPYSVLAVSGMTRSLNATTPQTFHDSIFVFDHWSQGGNASQNILINDTDKTYTAYFVNTGPANCSASGTILREYWSNVTGTTVSTVPVNSPPSGTSQLNIFEGPSNFGDNYGSRIRGYICPPSSGNYIFWIASDDNSELWLSTNDQPSNKVKIASVPGYTSSRQWTKYSSQQSAPISLVAGRKYYIEAIHKEGTQGDNLAVGWQLPNGIQERPIPGSRLSPFVSSSAAPTVVITAPANNTTYSNPANITINASVNSVNPVTKVEFFQGSAKIGEDLTSPYSFTWMNVTSGTYSIKAIVTDNTNHTGTSAPITVNVAACPTPVITATGPTTMCSGSVTLQTSNEQGSTYQWKKDGVAITGATNWYYTANATGDYQVKVTHGPCVAWSAPTHVKIQSGLSASITPGGPTTFCNGGNVVLYANTCSGYTYKWKKDGNYITGATAPTYTATTSGSYQVQITQNAQNAWSALVQVTVDPCREADSTALQTVTGIDSNSFIMKVYPNPNNGHFMIELNMPEANDEKVKISMVNMIGQVIYTREFLAHDNFIKETVEMSEALQSGVYTLQVMIGNKVENTNVVLSK
ncbi:MAG TPA: PQQ-dependent sugar dehydrogenase [Bacteroidia bacterium]